MNRIIKEQLNNCKIASIPEFDDDTTCLVIKKSNKKKEDLLLNHYYKIEVEDYIIHPYPEFTLHDNWNDGVVPKDKVMNCEITQIMGKMIRVNAVGVDSNNVWSGWLPRKSFVIVEELV